MINTGSVGQNARRGTLEVTTGYSDRHWYHWLEEVVKSLRIDSMMVESLNAAIV